MFFDCFWLRLGCHFGPIWEAKIDPNRPKMPQVGLKTALETIFFEKREFSRKPLKTNEKSIFLTPETPERLYLIFKKSIKPTEKHYFRKFSKEYIKPIKNQHFWFWRPPKDSIRFSKNHIKPMKNQHFWSQKPLPDSIQFSPNFPNIKKRNKNKGFLPQRPQTPNEKSIFLTPETSPTFQKS